MSLSTVATVTLEMGACWSLGWATHVFIKGHSSLLSNQDRANEHRITQAGLKSSSTGKLLFNLNLRFRINSTGTLHVPIKEDNIPQYIIICPLPLLVSTQQVQSEDVFPGLGSWFKAVAAVFGERLSWSGPKVSQSCGDQIVNATRRSLQRQREIRVIRFHWRQSDDVIGIDSLKGFKG